MSGNPGLRAAGARSRDFRQRIGVNSVNAPWGWRSGQWLGSDRELSLLNQRLGSRGRSSQS